MECVSKYCLACGVCLTAGINWHYYNARKNFYRCKYCLKTGKKQSPKYKNLNKPDKKIICRVCSKKLDLEKHKNDIKHRIYLCSDCKSKKHKKYVKDTQYNVIKLESLRKRLINKYGGKCRCCGESEFKFLTLDHVNNDGASERKQIKSINLYNQLIDLEVIDSRYQILCMNCNYTKGHHGFCPHTLIKRSNCYFCGIKVDCNNMFSFNLNANHSICKNCVLLKSVKLNQKRNAYKALYKKSHVFNLKSNVIGW